MAFDAHKNFAYSTVATAPSPPTSGTSLGVQSGEGANFPAVPFNATVWPAGSQPIDANAEIVRVTNIAADTFTITRTQESTSARSIGVGDQIAATITKKVITDIEGTGIVRPAGGGLETVDTIAAGGASQTIDLDNGNVYDLTLTAAVCTITLAGATNGQACSLTMLIRQDGTGGRLITWPGSITWLSGAAPVLHTAASAIDVVQLFSLDGGTTWFGSQVNPGAGSWLKVYDTTLGADASSIDTGAGAIPAGYTEILIEASIRSTRASNTSDALRWHLNNDSGANYNNEILFITGTTPAGSQEYGASGIYAECPGATGPTNHFGYQRIVIPDYASTTKLCTYSYDYDYAKALSSGNLVAARCMGVYNASGAAISRVAVVSTNSANLKAGSRVAIYVR